MAEGEAGEERTGRYLQVPIGFSNVEGIRRRPFEGAGDDRGAFAAVRAFIRQYTYLGPTMANSPTTYVLVHDAWHDGQSWNRVASLLTSRGHRVFTPSLTGHGDKAHLLTPEVGLTTHVDDVTGLVLEHDLDDIVLVGHS